MSNTPIVVAFDLVAKRISTIEAERIPFFVTSHPYPAETTEGVDVSASLISGLWGVWPFDEVDISAAVLEGTLRDPLVTYSMPAEAVDVTAAVISGILHLIYVTYTSPAEAVDISAEVRSGAIATVLITYSNWPAEAVDISASVQSGTLA